MRYALQNIYHFLVSNSRHGTHSPFVYALTDQVIYNSSYKPRRFIAFPAGFNPPYLNLLRKILSFWEIDNLSEDLQDQHSQAFWLGLNSQVDLEQLLSMVSRGKILIVHAPYNKQQQRLWRSLIRDTRVVVSINLFHFGIVLHRDGQRKENFLLRYSG
ncbi:MAG: hypothetical protein ACTHZ1_01050 [Sphingobacterium sp.]